MDFPWYSINCFILYVKLHIRKEALQGISSNWTKATDSWNWPPGYLTPLCVLWCQLLHTKMESVFSVLQVSAIRLRALKFHVERLNAIRVNVKHTLWCITTKPKIKARLLWRQQKKKLNIETLSNQTDQRCVPRMKIMRNKNFIQLIQWRQNNTWDELFLKLCFYFLRETKPILKMLDKKKSVIKIKAF